MNKLMKQFVFLAATAIVLAVAAGGPALAAESSYKFRNIFTSTAARLLASIFNTSTGHNHDGVNSRLISVPYPATQTITGGATVAADACGGVKRISAASSVTSSTTYTFASTATASNLPCVMDVVNVGVGNITLDNNAGFMTMLNQDIVLKSTRTVQVIGLAGVGWTQGGYWTTY
jgi:hypothetical protein